MVMTISQLQSSGLRGAVIYDYFEKITFILADKSPESGVFRMLARLDFKPGMEPTEVPMGAGMKVIKFYHRDENSGLATVDFTWADSGDSNAGRRLLVPQSIVYR